MTKERELKACDFCGGKMSIGNGYPDGYDAKCNNGKCYLADGAGFCFNDVNEAVGGWNNAPRTADAELVEDNRKLMAEGGLADAALDDFGGVTELVEALEWIRDNPDGSNVEMNARARLALALNEHKEI